MASEPQPPLNPPDVDVDADETTDQRLPKTAEDRKAAAALSSLTATDEPANDSAKTPSAADREALGKAMSRLQVADGPGAGAGAAGGKKAEKGEREKEVEEMRKREEERRRKVKVDQVDVGLLVEELELTKAKATDLLKANDGDAVRAMRAYVTSSA